METKELNVKVKGVNDFVETTYIQKHLPDDIMMLIILDNNSSLLCQKNHPLFIKRDEEILEIEAGDINYDDRIYVNNNTCFNDNKIIPKCNPMVTSIRVFNILNSNIEDYNFEFDNIKGTFRNFRLEPNFINYDKTWLRTFLSILIEKNINTKKIYSYNFISQLKMICDRVGFDFYIKDVIDSKDYGTSFKINIKNDYLEEKISDFIYINNFVFIKNWREPVYDIKTETKEFMLNGIQNHNSFHCIHKDSLLYVNYNDENKVMTFEEIWNDNLNDIVVNGDQEEKLIKNLNVWDKDKFTKVNKIIRHKKQFGTKMVMTRSNNGDFIISQDNHPHMFSLNKSVCKKCNTSFKNMNEIKKLTCSKCGKYIYANDFEQDNIYVKVKPKDNVKFKYFSYNSFPIWQKEKLTPNDYYILDNKFIYYSDEDLCKILCNILDNNGEFVINEQSYFFLNSESLDLIQKIHHILKKYNIKHNIILTPISNKKLTKHQSYTIKIYPTKKHNDIFKYSKKFILNKLPDNYKDINQYDSLVTYCKEVLFDDDQYVYDFTTDSGTLTCNGIWTHNTGGSVELRKVNFKDELISNLEDDYLPNIQNWFIFKDDALFLNYEMATLKIDKKIFKDEKIIKNKDRYILPLGYFEIRVGHLTIPVNIEQETQILITNEIKESPTDIIIIYGKNDMMVYCEPKAVKPEAVASSLDSYLGGKSPYSSTESLFTKLFTILKDFDNWDSVHLEVILSVIIRNRKDPRFPARLKEPYDMELFSVKSLPGVLSPYLGLAFENFSKALSIGLITPDNQLQVSDIEKILFGEPLSDLSIQKIKEMKKKR